MPDDGSHDGTAKNGGTRTGKMPGILVVSGGHDDVTRVLDYYAECYARDAGSDGATHVRALDAASIHEALRSNRDAAVFFFLHGRLKPPGVVVGQLQEEVIGRKTADLLRSRIVCGTCYSLNGLATMAVARGSTVIGYDGEMLVPTKQQWVQEMKEAALIAQHALTANDDAASAARKAREAYLALADTWFGTQTIEGQVHAAAANANSDAIGVKGTGSARLLPMKSEKRGHGRTKEEGKGAKRYGEEAGGGSERQLKPAG